MNSFRSPNKSVCFTIIVSFFFTFILPFEVLAGAVDKAMEPDVATAEYEGEYVNWKVIFSPEGAEDIEEELELEVDDEEGEKQLLMSIGNLKDPGTGPMNVRLEATDPKGKGIGQQKGQKGRKGKAQAQALGKAEAQALGLNPLPESKEFDAVIDKEKKGKKVKDEDVKKIYSDYKRKLKASKNTGFVTVSPQRFEDAGFSALQINNPDEEGQWKFKVKGKKAEPFIAVALTVPIEMTEEAEAELKLAYAKIGETLQRAFPNYLAWGNPCNDCKNVFWTTGAAAAILGLVAGAVSMGSGTVAVIAGYLGLFFAIVGVGAIGVGGAAAAWAGLFNKNAWCAVQASADFFCAMAGKCSLPSC